MKFLYFCTILLPIVFVPEGQTSNSNATVTLIDREKRLIGGETTEISAHPYYVSLEYNNVSMCGGAIVSNRHVLTAAHCIQGNFYGWYVRAGSDMVKKGGDLHLVHRFDPHPEFQKHTRNGFKNDIGVVTVCVSFRFNNNLKPVALFKSGELIRPNSTAVIVGVGFTQSGAMPTRLQKITVPVITRAQCHEYYKPRGAPEPGTFCAGFEQGGVGSCNGDSGGPVIVDGRLAGLVSCAISCGWPKSPEIITEVAFFNDWIHQRIPI